MSESMNSLPTTHQLYLIRHGDVDLHPDICYGQLDCTIHGSFTKDISKLSHYIDKQILPSLSNFDTPLIISSPLIRCQQLAQGLQAHLKQQNQKVQLQAIEAFKEINFGQWEGLSWQEIGQDQIECWQEQVFDYVFPEGESAADFHQRVNTAWQQLLTTLNQHKKPQTIILVLHAGVIRSILTEFLHMPLQHSLSLKVDKMSVSHLAIVPSQLALSRCMSINLSI
ncbi:hypothetical protein E2R68_04095 [Psychromonas sp. RZ22]|uniref:histidine phosphatase family protein n=1 Tax=Psychromonas algarum TaxID=2555643 RepID=UPI00106896DA|nr:histidine phosphatase family protein [Psychromonas sp. RZ22]TEW55577.1 hypothetical protein E2R68_04095 [Psychromonas sp. RZ22]